MGGLSSHHGDEVDAKSNDEILKTTIQQHGYWVNVYSANDETITFQAKDSYAVCAGVGSQLYCESSSLGLPADNDATIIYDTVTEHLGFQKDHVKLLKSTVEPATRSTIKSSLTSFAKNVTAEGVFLLHFSGHCQKDWGGEAVLVPADYNKTLDTVFTTDDFTDAIQGTNAKCVIVILDCCYAGNFAGGLVFADRLGSTTCVVAACNTSEESLSVESLGNSFFTYFVNRHLLTTSSSTGEFDGTKCTMYCTTLLEAVTDLLRPGRSELTSMTPINLFKSITTTVDDEVDAALPLRQRDSGYVLKFLTDKGNVTDLPEPVCVWLSTTATSALGVLNVDGALSCGDVYNTVLEGMVKSVTSIMCNCDTEVYDIRTLTKGDTFVMAYIRICEIFEHLHLELVPQLSHMESSLQYYVRKLYFFRFVKSKTWNFKKIFSMTSFGCKSRFSMKRTNESRRNIPANTKMKLILHLLLDTKLCQYSKKL